MNTRKDSLRSKQNTFTRVDQANQSITTVKVDRNNTNNKDQRGNARRVKGTIEDLRKDIIRALTDDRYKGRTISGVAQAIHRPAAEVVSTIKSDATLRGIIKVYPRRNADGKVLITTKERFSKQAGFKDKFIDLYTTNKISLDDAA